MTDKPMGCVNCGADDHDTKDCTRLPVVGVRVISDGFGSYLADSTMGLGAPYPGEVRERLCRLTDAQARLAEKDAEVAKWKALAESMQGVAEIAQSGQERMERLRAHIRADNSEALANALKEIERLNGLLGSQRLIIAMLGTCGMNIGNEREHLRAQLEQLQTAPAERGVVPTAWQLKGWNHCIETAAEAIAYLLKNGRPAAYGNSRYNEEHCRDIINSLSVELRERKEFFARLNPAPATAEFEPDAICKEEDGCPTENAVLKRFWREHHAQPVAKEIADAINWADHLLFECGALTHTRAPSIHVYNKTFEAVEAAKAVITAPATAEQPARNQCDGCQAGIPLVNGSHRMGKPGGYSDKMSCTAHLYDAPATGDSDVREVK